MASRSLSSLPSGSDVFLDANIFIYGLSGVSTQCRTLLGRCADEEVIGLSSYHVISEVTHRLMCVEAQRKGLAGQNPSQALSAHPERVQQLGDYWSDIERLLSLNLLILAVDERAIRGAHAQRKKYGLLNNDSFIVALMRNYGISQLASHDAAFNRVSDFELYSPTDL